MQEELLELLVGDGSLGFPPVVNPVLEVLGEHYVESKLGEEVVRKLLELSLNNEPRTIDNPEFVAHTYWYALYQTLDALRVSDISTAAPSGDMFQLDEEDNM